MVGCYGHCWFQSTGAQTRCHGFSIEVSKPVSIFGNDCSEFDISLALILRFQCFWSLFWFCVCFLPQKGRNWSYFYQVPSMWTKTSVFAPWQVVGLHMDTLSAAVQLRLTPNPQTSCILEVRSPQKPTLVWMQRNLATTETLILHVSNMETVTMPAPLSTPVMKSSQRTPLCRVPSPKNPLIITHFPFW